jgi:hypothetical protein
LTRQPERHGITGSSEWSGIAAPAIRIIPSRPAVSSVPTLPTGHPAQRALGIAGEVNLSDDGAEARFERAMRWLGRPRPEQSSLRADGCPFFGG